METDGKEGGPLTIAGKGRWKRGSCEGEETEKAGRRGGDPPAGTRRVRTPTASTRRRRHKSSPAARSSAPLADCSPVATPPMPLQPCEAQPCRGRTAAQRSEADFRPQAPPEPAERALPRDWLHQGLGETGARGGHSQEDDDSLHCMPCFHERRRNTGVGGGLRH